MKNLLIITQKVDQDDDVLGFFIEWIRKLAERADKVNIICLFKGNYDLPANVRVFSLGKEEGRSKLKYLTRFYKYIWQLRNEYDSVFVHMNPRYVVLGGPLWKSLNKKIVLWYAHGHVNAMLKMADRITDVAVASTPEGYRIPGPKVKIIGQGIDTEKFKLAEKERGSGFKIISVGRISPSKDYETLIKAVEILRDKNIKVEIAGQPAAEKDIQYLEYLEKLIDKKDLQNIFKFIGPIANKNLPPFLQSADLFANMSHTGSLDKAILEAMSCGLPVLTCNEALENVLGSYAGKLMYSKRDHQALADRISFILNISPEERNKLSSDLREIVVRGHNLDSFIDRLSNILLEN